MSQQKIDHLKERKTLLDIGIITKEEFAREKAELMGEKVVSNVRFLVLSLLFPFIGLILYCAWYDAYPRRATSCLNGVIIGVIVGVIVGIGAIVGIVTFY